MIARRFLLGAAQAAFARAGASARRAFLTDAASAGDLEQAQLAKLGVLVGANAWSRYGNAHEFARITSIKQWQTRIPMVDYDAIEPWIARIAAGEEGVLTREPVLMLERSGGSTSTTKLVPYTAGLKSEFSAATDVWISDLFAHAPGLLGGTSYFAISPVGNRPRATEGGVPIGFEDDTEYFDPVTRWVWRRMLSVPPEIARESDVEEWRRRTCTALLADEDLGLLSVWSPTFLTGLIESIEARWDSYLAALAPSRARALDRARSRLGGTLTGRALWPRLAVVSCWTDGVSASFARPLATFFEGVLLQPKGLLATEGVVTIPLLPAALPEAAARRFGREGGGAGGTGTQPGAPVARVLAWKSHFYEFLDLEAGEGARPLLAHELREGATYSPLLSTAGGLFRYHLKDALRCDGHVGALPVLRFEGKLDRVSDLCGEKINMRQVEEGLARAAAQTGARWDFALLAPDLAPPRYVLYLESGAPEEVLTRVAQGLEEHLLTGHHYAYARRLGQLAPLAWRRVRDGQRAFEDAMVAAGARRGTVKPAVLDARTHWGTVWPAEIG